MTEPLPNPAELVPFCPICLSDRMTVTRTQELDVCLCEQCGTNLTVPHNAWRMRTTLIKRVTRGD